MTAAARRRELKHFIDIDFQDEEFVPSYVVAQRPGDAPREVHHF